MHFTLKKAELKGNRAYFSITWTPEGKKEFQPVSGNGVGMLRLNLRQVKLNPLVISTLTLSPVVECLVRS